MPDRGKIGTLSMHGHRLWTLACIVCIPTLGLTAETKITMAKATPNSPSSLRTRFVLSCPRVVSVVMAAIRKRNPGRTGHDHSRGYALGGGESGAPSFREIWTRADHRGGSLPKRQHGHAPQETAHSRKGEDPRGGCSQRSLAGLRGSWWCRTGIRENRMIGKSSARNTGPFSQWSNPFPPRQPRKAVATGRY